MKRQSEIVDNRTSGSRAGNRSPIVNPGKNLSAAAFDSRISVSAEGF